MEGTALNHTANEVDSTDIFNRRTNFMNRISWIFLLIALMLFSCKDTEQKQGAVKQLSPSTTETPKATIMSQPQKSGEVHNEKAEEQINAVLRPLFAHCDTVVKKHRQLIEDPNGPLREPETGKRYRQGDTIASRVIVCPDKPDSGSNESAN
jgi:hypothetical protein